MWTAIQKAWLQECSSRLQRLEAQRRGLGKVGQAKQVYRRPIVQRVGGKVMRLWLSGASRGSPALLERQPHREACLALIMEDWAPPPRGRRPRAGPQPGLSSWPVTHPDCMSQNGEQKRWDNPVLSREVWTGTTFQRKRDQRMSLRGASATPSGGCLG